MAEENEGKAESSGLRRYLKDAPFFCKIIQLLFCVISVGLIVDPFNNSMQEDLNHAGIVYVSICGYILINVILILCYLLGEKMPKRMSLIFAVMGAILCFIAGLVLIHDWNNFQGNMISRYLQQYLDQMVSSGVFAILASVAFALDAYLINKCE